MNTPETFAAALRTERARAKRDEGRDIDTIEAANRVRIKFGAMAPAKPQDDAVPHSNEHAPTMAVAHAFAACIRAHLAQLSASGKDAGSADTFLEAARLARAAVERATAEAQQRTAMSTKNAQPLPWASARSAPAASVGVAAQRGHLSAAPKAPRDLASLGPMAVSFAIGFGRLDDASRAIVERIKSERSHATGVRP
jgi:hypothetical protein